MNLKEQKLFEKEFKELLEKNKKSLKFKTNLELEKKTSSKKDISKLISCSKNYYEDLIKIKPDILPQPFMRLSLNHSF